MSEGNAYIFLDVDGVLNNAHAKGIRQGFCWLDDGNVAMFAEMVRACQGRYGEEGTKVILSSSWRSNSFLNKSDCMSSLLAERLAKEGVRIDGETESLDGWSRGTEIAEYLLRHRDKALRYAVLDDVLWEDFKPLGITRHWVQTSDDPRNGAGGLRRRHVKPFLKALETPITEEEFERLERKKRKE